MRYIGLARNKIRYEKVELSSEEGDMAEDIRGDQLCCTFRNRIVNENMYLHIFIEHYLDV